MHPYAIDEMVRERHDELVRLGRADRGVQAARRARLRATSRLPVTLAALADRIGWRPAPRRVLQPCPRSRVRPW